jgi:indolepyruvate ferredoxin oxidoreductase
MAPPLLGERDPVTGQSRKRRFGPWLLPVLRVLARLKHLRGTRLDPFGWTAERRAERRLIEDYAALLDRLVAALRPDNHTLAVELAALPQQIRGFGHVKAANVERAKAREAELLAELAGPLVLAAAAE